MKIFQRKGEMQPAGSSLQHLVGDERGSVAIWVGLALITFIGCAGMAVDTARGYMVKARLSQALDAAALAGAKSLLSDTRTDDINMFFNANFNADAFSATVVGPTINVDAAKNTVKVSATATIDTTLMSVLGFTTMTVAAEATAIRAINGLDVVVSIDMSGSMCIPTCDKIKAAIAAANTMVTTLYSDPNPKTVIINGTSYDLLNIGMVPWNSRVNVTTNSAVSSATYKVGETVPVAAAKDFQNPLKPDTEPKQTQVYKTNVSEVLFLDPPDANWTGGVYARYLPDGDQTNDADMTLGYTTVGNKEWYAFEAVPSIQGLPQSGNWTQTQAGTNFWKNRTSKSCYESYWNDGLADPDHPDAVPSAPFYWKPSLPTIPYGAWEVDCDVVLSMGILPLQPVKDDPTKLVVTKAINSLYDTNAGTKPIGGTNVPQGLYWAWEVLMPGAPFSQAKESVPFKRTQAIVLLSDGANFGTSGDAYRGTFGWKDAARTNSQHGTLPSGKNNNLDNRVLDLATKIKGADPAQGVKIFVIQYVESDPTLATLLKQVATEPNAPYYFYAPGATELENAFKQIAASLSVLRLEQ